MSSALVLLLFLLLAAPAVLAFVRRDLGWITGGFYGAVAAGLLAWHVGFAIDEIPDAAAIAKARAGGAGVQGSRCEQVLATAEQGRVVLDRRNPNRLVVSAALWPQLPEEVRTALSQCADTIRPADQRERPVEVVQR
ncbi:MAG TPA: hypothetical protein VEZ20_04235 [Allosphingosinicella sp.]|jgi:hypothetical protein|nr:hypothetical protein [Allosphingosinicella sp.]